MIPNPQVAPSIASRGTVFFGLVCLFAGCVGGGDAPADPEVWKSELMAADRAFAAETAERGLDGWMAYMAESATMFSGPQPVRGFTSVREYMLPALESENFSLAWDPTEAEVSPDGNLGYTFGRYERTVTLEGGEEQSVTGNYVTIWRRQEDSRWKVVFDMGDEDR